MNRFIIAFFDLLHLATNLAFFVIGFNLKLTPLAAFIYMPLILLAIWSVFFGFRSYLLHLRQAQTESAQSSRLLANAAHKPLSTVLES